MAVKKPLFLTAQLCLHLTKTHDHSITDLINQIYLSLLNKRDVCASKHQKVKKNYSFVLGFFLLLSTNVKSVVKAPQNRMWYNFLLSLLYLTCSLFLLDLTNPCTEALQLFIKSSTFPDLHQPPHSFTSFFPHLGIFMLQLLLFSRKVTTLF